MVVPGTMLNKMPELPEVETIKNTLANLIKGKTIDHVKVLREKNLNVSQEQFSTSLKGKTFEKFERIGKFLVFKFDTDLVMVSHLRMEGKYFLRENNEPVQKHDIVLFYFTDQTYLAYNDTRKFGYLGLFNEENYKNVPPLSNVGPDPFMLDNISLLQKAFKNKSIPIKQALLDQSIMSGLGNIYVDEVLYKCKIHPLTPAKMVSNKDLKNILDASKVVLNKAIKAGGSTIKSYHPAQGVSGNFQVELEVYGKKGQNCSRCGTKLKKIFVNGRGTTFCPKCQKDLDKPHIVAITGAISTGKSFVSDYLKTKGYIKYDADEIVHELYKDRTIIKGINAFIPTLKLINGQVDRKFLKQYLIENPNKKIRLEKFIWKKVEEFLNSKISKLHKDDNVVLEIPLLFASGLDYLADEIYIVEVSPKVQKERLEARNGDYKAYLELNKSYKAQEQKKKATAIINNDSDVASLVNSIEKIIFGK